MKRSSNDTSRLLRQIITQYRLTVNGTSFWVPYWINFPRSLDGVYLGAPDLKGAYKGKGTPGQLRSALVRHIQSERLQPNSARDYRRLMRRWGLGVDCSGFVYYVLNRYLRAMGLPPLRTATYLPKADVLELWDKYRRQRRPGLPRRQQVEQLPDPVPMTRFAPMFHKNPINHTNVARLVGTKSVVPVRRAGDIRPADLIKMSSDKFDHVGIVVNVTTKFVIYVSSDDVRNGLGGIRFHTLQIKNPNLDLQHNHWPDGRRHTAGKRDGVWRSVLLGS